MSDKPAKTWEITINNPTEEDRDTLNRFVTEVSRILISEEIGKKGTKHLQGRICFKRAYRMNALKKLIPRAHWEKTKASEDWLYAQKADSKVIIDQNNNNQGKRTDWDNLVTEVKNGISEQKLWEDYPTLMVRYHTGILKLKQKLQCKGTTSTYPLKWSLINTWAKSHIIWGEPGIGKTEYAKAHFKNALLVSHIDDLRKFIPEEHDGIIFDDMDFRKWPRTAQIHLLDIDNDRSIHCRYDTAFIPARTKKLFTTNEKNGEIFDLDDKAISRRVTVTEVKER